MKAHPAFLAFSVLCLLSASTIPRASAQTPAASAEVDPPSPPALSVEPPPPILAPTTAPPTAVDTTLTTPVHTEPPAPAPPSATPPPATAPLPPTPVVTAASGRAKPPSPAVAPHGLGAPRLRDAHHDRLLIAPTAETNPSGSFYATSYEIFLLQIGYSLSDSTQISLTATPPLGDEGIVPGDISIKTVVLREPHVSVAAIASASGVVGFEEFSGFLGRAGGAVTLCADAHECPISISLGSSFALAGPASVWFNGVGVNWRVGRIVSLIAEVDTLLPLAEPVGEANGVLGGVGVRLSGRAWGVDLALMKAGKAGAEASNAIPFIAATYRYVP
jgi:hypothetical protein